jgi:hypothetical protein
MPDMQLQSAIESSEFYANKFRVAKVQADNLWIKALLDAMKAVRVYVKASWPSGLAFKGQTPWG